ncbi:MAG: 30S ribosomal protein S3ae [Candidatus Micrarchaeota archaeon]|nr:30S ribosomal protein S3ae [Candidatus Micrarchaeota archaeon]
MKRRVKKKLKGKEWYKVVAPKFLGDLVLGETPALDEKNVLGRKVEASLMEISNDPTKYYIKLIFKINDIRGGVARTQFYGHECTRDFLARIVHKRSSRIDTNDVFTLKDGKLRIKTITVTTRRVDTSVKTEIRKKVVELLKEMTAEMGIEDFVKSFILGKIQPTIKKKLEKIYPVKVFEIMKSNLEEVS